MSELGREATQDGGGTRGPASWEGCGLGSGSLWFIKKQKPCPEQSTPAAATMKGALLVLALLVTRELTFETREGRVDGNCCCWAGTLAG